MNNLKQIFLAAQLYSDDYNGWYPAGYYWDGVNELGWFVMLAYYVGYLKSPTFSAYSSSEMYYPTWELRFFRCPSDKTLYQNDRRDCNYAINGYFNWSMTGSDYTNYYDKGFSARNASQIKSPNEMMAFCDYWNNKEGLTVRVNRTTWVGSNSAYDTSARHSNGASVCYADGHVKWLSYIEMNRLRQNSPESTIFWGD